MLCGVSEPVLDHLSHIKKAALSVLPGADAVVGWLLCHRYEPINSSGWKQVRSEGSGTVDDGGVVNAILWVGQR